MSRLHAVRSRAARASRLARLGLAAGIAAPVALAAWPAFAQSSPCGEVQKHIEERKAIIARLQELGGKKKQVNPKDACAMFGKLVANGNTTLKWAETNKDWCQVPDSFVEGMKNDHNRATSLRGQACGAAAKQAQMERQARQQAEQQQGGRGGGLLGGPGLSGEYKIPQGAL